MKGCVVKAPSGRILYVLPNWAPEPDDHYNVPMYGLIEVDGSFIGSRFIERQDTVDRWKVIARPVGT